MRPFHVMTKPIGPICNLDCKYCFYLEKEKMLQAEALAPRTTWQMSDNVLEAYIQQYIASQPTPEVTFAWQGGEPTLLGVRFFQRVRILQNRYADGRPIHNAIQTNGTLLDDEWCEFLAKERFLVGISIDGPARFHDTYRVDNQQKPTFDAVMHGMDLLKLYNVEFNTLTVVNRVNAAEPLEIYRFLKQIGSGFIQFIPLVERYNIPTSSADNGLIQIDLAPPPQRASVSSEVTEWSVLPEQYGQFLVTVFDEWVHNDVGSVFVQLFDSALGTWLGEGASLCVFAETCGSALAMEQSGDLYSCDHFVYPQYRLGNIQETGIADLAHSEAQLKFGKDKQDSLPRYCRECSVRFACNGECPKHRFLTTPDGEFGLNYLCAAYKKFFSHIDPYMKTMAHVLRTGRSPAEIMATLRASQGVAIGEKTGRNERCPCGSGKKYKRCCLLRSHE